MPFAPRARVLVLESEANPLTELAQLLNARAIRCDRDSCGEAAYIRATEARRTGPAETYGCIVVDLDCTSFGAGRFTPEVLLQSLRLAYFGVPFIGFTANPERIE